MSLPLAEKFSEKEVFSSSHSYFTRNLVLFRSDYNKLNQVVYYIRRNIGHRIVTASWIGWGTNLSNLRIIAVEALNIVQKIPLLNFYSITSFFSLILTLLFLAFLLSLPWNFSLVERALESHSSLRGAPFILVKLWMWALLHSSALWITRTHSPMNKNIKQVRTRSKDGVGATKTGSSEVSGFILQP